MIPKNIIQTYKTVDSIPPKYQKFIQTIKDLHPDYNYMFYNDDDVDKFITTEFPNILSLYNNFKYNIQRFDLFRLLVIYKYGGFYFDIDVEITKRIDDLRDNHVVFPIEFGKDIIVTSAKGKIIPKYTYMDDQLGQYAFASEQNNMFLKTFIYNIVTQKIPINEISDNKQEYVCCTTGPRLLTLTYYEYDNKQEVTLLKNSEDKPIRFGDYGQHWCFGSWL